MQAARVSLARKHAVMKLGHLSEASVMSAARHLAQVQIHVGWFYAKICREAFSMCCAGMYSGGQN